VSLSRLSNEVVTVPYLTRIAFFTALTRLVFNGGLTEFAMLRTDNDHFLMRRAEFHLGIVVEEAVNSFSISNKVFQ
jgi:hypothetical protein